MGKRGTVGAEGKGKVVDGELLEGVKACFLPYLYMLLDALLGRRKLQVGATGSPGRAASVHVGLHGFACRLHGIAGNMLIGVDFRGGAGYHSILWRVVHETHGDVADGGNDVNLANPIAHNAYAQREHRHHAKQYDKQNTAVYPAHKLVHVVGEVLVEHVVAAVVKAQQNADEIHGKHHKRQHRRATHPKSHSREGGDKRAHAHQGGEKPQGEYEADAPAREKLAVKQVSETEAKEHSGKEEHQSVDDLGVGREARPVVVESGKPRKEVDAYHKIGRHKQTLGTAVGAVVFSPGRFDQSHKHGKGQISSGNTLYQFGKILNQQIHIVVDNHFCHVAKQLK